MVVAALRPKVSTQPLQELFGADRCAFVYADLVMWTIRPRMAR